MQYALEKNDEVVKHIIMVGELKYKVYKTPQVVDLVFDTEDKAQEVADVLNAKVIEYFYDAARWKNTLAA